MPDISIRGATAKEKERRWPGLLALAVFLFVVAAALHRASRPAPKPSPAASTGGPAQEPAAAPTAREPEPGSTTRPPETELTVSRFLTVLARETPKATGERFLTAFARRPALRRTIVDFKRTHGDAAPAKELVHALLAQPEFRGLLGELRSDPDFTRTFARLARDAEVSSTLRGSMALARADRAPGGGERSEVSDEGPDDESGAASGSDAPSQEQGGGGQGAGEHDVQPKLAAIKTKVGERHARRFVLSALASMPKELLEELDAACAQDDLNCDPVVACGMTGLWDACVKACRVSGKCPPALMDGAQPGASLGVER